MTQLVPMQMPAGGMVRGACQYLRQPRGVRAHTPEQLPQVGRPPRQSHRTRSAAMDARVVMDKEAIDNTLLIYVKLVNIPG